MPGLSVQRISNVYAGHNHRDTLVEQRCRGFEIREKLVFGKFYAAGYVDYNGPGTWDAILKAHNEEVATIRTDIANKE